MAVFLVAAYPRASVDVEDECEAVVLRGVGGQIEIVGVVLSAAVGDVREALAVGIVPLGVKLIEENGSCDDE